MSSFSTQQTPLPGAMILRPVKIRDERGYFTVPFNRQGWEDTGIPADFIQDNESLSVETGTLRGLHFQLPPFEQAKLVRVVSGRITDVIVDARTGSPTYGRHHMIELSAESGEQVFVPRGFLHGFVTREPNTIVLYKVDNQYSAGNDRSIRWDDPDLGIDWKLGSTRPILSPKDTNAGKWSDIAGTFVHSTD